MMLLGLLKGFFLSVWRSGCEEFFWSTVDWIVSNQKWLISTSFAIGFGAAFVEWFVEHDFATVIIIFFAVSFIVFIGLLVGITVIWGGEKFDNWISNAQANKVQVWPVIGFSCEDLGQSPKWKISNNGATAFNITSKPIVSGPYYSVLEEIPKLELGGFVEAKFVQYESPGESRGPVFFLEPAFEAAYGSNTDWKIIPVALTYKNGLGHQFLSEWTIHWKCHNGISKTRIEPKETQPLDLAPTNFPAPCRPQALHSTGRNRTRADRICHPQHDAAK
jgi:hypothetical protein